MCELLSADGGRQGELVPSSPENVPKAAEDMRYGGDPSRYLWHHFPSSWNLPTRKNQTAFDREVQEEVDMLQWNESIPYVSIKYIQKAIKTEREED